MRPRTLAVLLLLVVALGSFIWLYERDLPSTDERAELGKRLLRLDPETVRAVTLVSGDRRLRIERSQATADSTTPSNGGEWKLIEPRERRADGVEVETFLEDLLQLERERTLEDVSSNEVGLDDPRAEVALETATGETIVRFGAEIPASSKTVVEIGGGPPFYVVSGALLDDMAREPNDWRSRDVLPFDTARIERLEILDPAEPVVLERAGDGFRVASPIEDDADRAAVDELLQALVALEAEDFLDDGRAAFPDPAAALRLKVEGLEEPVLLEMARGAEEGAPLRLRVGEEAFSVDTDLASLLERSPGEWRSTRWTDLEAFEVDALRFERSGGEQQELALRQGEWTRGEENLDYSVVSAFLRSLAEARGEVVETGASSLESPEIEIELESKDGRVETLRLWSRPERDVVQRLDRAVHLELDAGSAGQFRKTLEALEAALVGDASSESE